MLKYYTKMLKFALMFKLLIQLFILLVFFSNCGNIPTDFEKEAEIQYLDTLDARLAAVKGMLDKVDLDDIEERKEIIENKYKFCDMKYREKNIIPDADVVRMMDEYKALEKIYEKATENYKPIVMELEELLIQVKTLRQSANEKDYNKETFKTYFNKEKEDVLKLYAVASSSLKPCIETEPVFERRQKEVEELAESLKK